MTMASNSETKKRTPHTFVGGDPYKLLGGVLGSGVGSWGLGDESISSWDAPEPDEVEGWISGYTVEALIERGGMGAVYKVFHKGLQQTRALKVLPLSVSLRPDFEERFLREARVMASLDHPSIVHVYDSDRSPDGHLYYVMEFVDGDDLSHLIQEGALSEDCTLAVVSQVAEALEYAHGKGCIHRDIKPSNVLQRADGLVKVVDFGLARMLDDRDEVAPNSGMTELGEVMGTPGYMSPEQSTGEAVDHRADLYALGVLTYELLTGSRPQGNFVLPSEKSGVCKSWDTLVMRAMKQEVTQRYQCVSEFKEDLADCGPHSGGRLRSWAGGKGLLVTALGALACVLGVFVFIKMSPWEAASGIDSTAETGETSSSSSSPPQLNKPYQNTLGMTFVPIRGSSVLFGKWETRWSDWDAFLSATDHKWTDPGFNHPGDHPAMNLSWHDAQAFCVWLTEKERAEGRIGAEMRYRLPSDAEWSAAAGLSSELEAPPEMRSGKIGGVYPWGSEWPPPEALGIVVDDGEAFDVMRGISDSYQRMARPMAPEKIEDFKRVTFALYRKPWSESLKEVAELFVALPEYAAGVMVMATDEAVIHYWDGKTVVLLGEWMGHHARWTLNHVGWKCADWTNDEFRAFFKKEDWGHGGDLLVGSSAVWSAREAEWKLEGRSFLSEMITEDMKSALDKHKDGQMCVKVEAGKLQFFSAALVTKVHPVVVFEGHLERSDLRRMTEAAFAKLRKKWEQEVEAIGLSFLPKYENNWQSRSSSVDATSANAFGICGLAGGAKEWVEDKYDDGKSERRTLRGGSIRLRGRGPTANAIKQVQKTGASSKEVVDFMVNYAIAPEQELLSSQRQGEAPNLRKQWFGFRPVLAFKK